MIQDLTTLVEIDFLPESYRQRSVHRRAYMWRAAAAAALAFVFTATALWQRGQYARVQSALADVDVQFGAAAQKNAKVAEVATLLGAERTSAALLTYLRHRWPRTQIMAAILAPLPDSVMLTEWHIGHEPLPNAAAPTVALGEGEAAPADKSARRAHDLTRLLNEDAARQHFVFLTGDAADAATLHEYLARLGTNDLFSRIDLKSLEHAAEKSPGATILTIHFSARAILRPGHGQAVPPQPAATRPPGEGAGASPLAQRGASP